MPLVLTASDQRTLAFLFEVKDTGDDATAKRITDWLVANTTIDPKPADPHACADASVR